MPKSVAITDSISIGRDQPLLVIAGPCQIESLEHCLAIANHLKELSKRLGFNLVFKASYDKANRTSVGGTRGVGMETGLGILREIKDQLKIPVLTDIHESNQAEIVAKIVDVVQIPAFLCRQTDLLVAAGKTGKCVNIKKGQFLAPSDMRFAADKVASTGNEKITLCERGSTFGYRDLVVDFRSLDIMRETGYPVIFDATHSVQSPGGASGQSGGDRRFIPSLAKAAAAVGIDGLFLECHECPERSPSDAAVILDLNRVEGLIKDVLKIQKALIDGL